MSIRHCRCILNEDIQSYLLLAFSYTLYGDGIYDIFFTHVKKKNFYQKSLGTPKIPFILLSNIITWRKEYVTETFNQGSMSFVI